MKRLLFLILISVPVFAQHTTISRYYADSADAIIDKAQTIGNSVFVAPAGNILKGVNDFAMPSVGNIGSAGNLWYGHVVKRSDGVLVYGYMYGGSQCRTLSSSDNGITWIGPVTGPTTTIGGRYIDNCSFGILNSGRYVFFYHEDSSSGKVLGLHTSYSDDNGVTWSTPTNISYGQDCGTTGGFTQLPGGQVLTAFSDGSFGYQSIKALYGNPANKDTTYIKVIKSADNGATWGAPVIAYASHDSVFQLNKQMLDEPGICADHNGKLVILCRSLYYGMAQLTSADGGSTWSYAGVVGQSTSPPGPYSVTPTPSLICVSDTVFLVGWGQRLYPNSSNGSPDDKRGYYGILKGTWNSVASNPSFGWSTYMPMTYIGSGDCGAQRICPTADSALLVMQLEGGNIAKLTTGALAAMRQQWMNSGRISSQVIVDNPVHLPDRTVQIDSTTWWTYGRFDLPMPAQYDTLPTNFVGAINVASIFARGVDYPNQDTCFVQLTDKYYNPMPAQPGPYLSTTVVNGVNSNWKGAWQIWFPTKYRDAGGTVSLSQFEKNYAEAVLVEVRSGIYTPCLTNVEAVFGHIWK